MGKTAAVRYHEKRKRHEALMQFKRAHQAMSVLSKKYNLPMMAFVLDPVEGTLSGTSEGPFDDLVRGAINTLKKTKAVPPDVMRFVIASNLGAAFGTAEGNVFRNRKV